MEHEQCGEADRGDDRRAQVDLVEFTLLKAYLNAGRLDDVQRLLRERRAGAIVMPIAGLPALH
ncbi:hypothetical protein [Elioraea sp.]|uniref:hypothetical protein n=1 Tax=Elioraea sp. TaxID=2185103 RepID=UPI003F728182